MDWRRFQDFLHTLGVEWGGVEPEGSQMIGPLMTLLQRSHDHEAFYRVDWLERGPELLVLLPTDEAPLKFHFYLVRLSEVYPLHSALSHLLHYRGSELFEQRRDVAEWHVLHASVETMKTLFWAGQHTSQFPPEITVQKIC